MKYATALIAFAATALAQSGPGGSVTENVTPPQSAPGNCLSTFNVQGSKTFTFNTVNITNSKRDLEELVERQTSSTLPACGGDGSLTLTLTDGKLLDSKGRTGYIADNRQFQFDGPPQAGAKLTAGWAYCPDSQTLVLGSQNKFYNCLSGTFNNIYDQSQGGQCYPVSISVIPCASSGSVASQPVSQSGSSTSSQNIMSMMRTQTTNLPPYTTPAASTPAGTAPVGTASNTVPTTTKGATSSPSPFVGAAGVVEAGQKLVGLAAGAAAFALL